MVNKYLLTPLLNAGKFIAGQLINSCLPQSCLICRDVIKNTLPICKKCDLFLNKQSLIKIPQCIRCALPLPDSSQSKPAPALLCPRCIATPPDFSRCIAALRYDPISGLIINRFKHRELLAARGIICARMIDSIIQRHHLGAIKAGAKGIKKPAVDLVVPMPLHHKRLRQRGFNQALEIAKPIASYFELPIALNACKRTRHACAQQGLNSRQRAKNLDNAFSVYANQVAGRKIAMVDDVVTTTHTARSLAKALIEAGATDCEVWCFARTPIQY